MSSQGHAALRGNSEATFGSKLDAFIGQGEGGGRDGVFAVSLAEEDGFFATETADSIVSKAEDDEMQILRYEDVHLVKRVHQLEAQIDETRQGQTEIFNQTDPDGLERFDAFDDSQDTGIPETDGDTNKVNLGSLFENEVNRHLTEQPQPAMSFDSTPNRQVTATRSKSVAEMARLMQSWRREKDRLKSENKELDSVIGEMKVNQHTDQPGLNCHLKFSKNIELLEQTLTRKADRIAHLEGRIDWLAKEEEALVARLEECEDERRGLTAEKEAAIQRNKEITILFDKEKARSTELESQIRQKEGNAQQLKSQIAELRRKLEEVQKKSKSAFGCFKKSRSRPNERETPLSSRSPPTVSASPLLGPSGLVAAETIAGSVHEGGSTDAEARETDAVPSGAVALLEKQLKLQEEHVNELRSHLRTEERVRMNLERLLMEGNDLIQALVTGCKARLRCVQGSLEASLKDTSKKKAAEAVEAEIESIVAFLEELKPLDVRNAKEVESAIIDPPLHPEEKRSEAIKIV